MESAGKYWILVWNVLEDSFHVVTANPKWVSAVKGNKDDKKDSKWIGDLFRMGLVPSSYIPSEDIRILREFTRYRSKLVSMRSSEKNSFQNAFTVCTAVFKIKAHIHKNETTLNSQKAKHSERRVGSRSEAHPVTLP